MPCAEDRLRSGSLRSLMSATLQQSCAWPAQFQLASHLPIFSHGGTTAPPFHTFTGLYCAEGPDGLAAMASSKSCVLGDTAPDKPDLAAFIPREEAGRQVLVPPSQISATGSVARRFRVPMGLSLRGVHEATFKDRIQTNTFQTEPSKWYLPVLALHRVPGGSQQLSPSLYEREEAVRQVLVPPSQILATGFVAEPSPASVCPPQSAGWSPAAWAAPGLCTAAGSAAAWPARLPGPPGPGTCARSFAQAPLETLCYLHTLTRHHDRS